MADTITHRGPDDDGYYVEGAVGFGFRRLSIIDLSGGHQPLANEDDTVWIVFNGEIYNYQELRELLLSKGHTFKTKTDTEVIVHLYEEFGEHCVEKLRGMFAFAIWDKTNEKLFIARDRVGIKPLYYHHSSEALLFASEIKEQYNELSSGGALRIAQRLLPGQPPGVWRRGGPPPTSPTPWPCSASDPCSAPRWAATSRSTAPR